MTQHQQSEWSELAGSWIKPTSNCKARTATTLHCLHRDSQLRGYCLGSTSYSRPCAMRWDATKNSKSPCPRGGYRLVGEKDSRWAVLPMGEVPQRGELKGLRKPTQPERHNLRHRCWWGWWNRSHISHPTRQAFPWGLGGAISKDKHQVSFSLPDL